MNETNQSASVVTDHGICRMRYVSLVQALKLKTKGISISRNVNPVKVVKQDYPDIAHAKDLLGAVETLPAIRCYCEEGRKVATAQGVGPDEPVYIMK